MADIVDINGVAIGDISKMNTVETMTLVNGMNVTPYDWDSFNGDNFDGVDDDPPDPAVWTVEPPPKKPAKINTNKLKYILSLDEEGIVDSKFKLRGHFSVDVLFDIVSESATSYIRMEFWDSLTNPTNGGYMGVYYDGGPVYASNYYENSSWQGTTTRFRGNSYGGLRMTRTSTDLLSSFEKDGTDAYTNLKLNRQDPVDYYVRLRGFSNASGAITFNLNNFVINSGTVVKG